MRPFRCLYLIPGIREPQTLTLVEGEDGTLPLLQALVGGLIECVSLTPIYDLWVNEEGLLLDLPRNRAHLCGPIVVTRTNEAGATIGLDDLDIHRLKGVLAGIPVA